MATAMIHMAVALLLCPAGESAGPHPAGADSPTLARKHAPRAEHHAHGAQGEMILPTGRNHRRYRKGNEYGATAWLARRLGAWVSTGARLDWRKWSDYRGADRMLMPMLVPTADPELWGGSRLDGGVSVNFVVPRGPLKGNRLAIEYLFPLYQWLDGPQLETDARLIAGWQYTF